MAQTCSPCCVEFLLVQFSPLLLASNDCSVIFEPQIFFVASFSRADSTNDTRVEVCLLCVAGDGVEDVSTDRSCIITVSSTAQSGSQVISAIIGWPGNGGFGRRGRMWLMAVTVALWHYEPGRISCLLICCFKSQSCT